jgi:hypothetical protein
LFGASTVLQDSSAAESVHLLVPDSISNAKAQLDIAKAQRDIAKAQRDIAKAQRDIAKAQLDAVQDTNTWKFFKPYRALKRFLSLK